MQLACQFANGLTELLFLFSLLEEVVAGLEVGGGGFGFVGEMGACLEEEFVSVVVFVGLLEGD